VSPEAPNEEVAMHNFTPLAALIGGILIG